MFNCYFFFVIIIFIVELILKVMYMEFIKDNKKYFYLLIAAVILFGVTYAISVSSSLFQATTSKINIDEEAYGNTSFDSSNIKFIPILDSEVENSINNVIKISFNVGGAKGNDSLDNVIYDIALNKLDVSCDLLSPYVKWKLIKNGEELSNGSLDYKFDTIRNKRIVLTNIQEDLPVYSVNGYGYDNYIFYMWLSDSCQDELGVCNSNGNLIDQSSLLNKSISGKIEVEVNTGNKKSLVRKPSNDLDTTTCIND